MPEHYNTAFGQIVDWMDQQRKAQRDQEDAELDKRIALTHDLINGPGANPARTAQGLADIMSMMSAKGGRGQRAKGMEGFMGKGVMPDPTLLSGLIHGSIPMQGNTTEPVPMPQSPVEKGAMPEASAILPGLSTSLHPQSYNGGIENGNIDLAAQPSVPNPDGSHSTVDSSSYGFDGKEVLLPSVTPDGRHLQGDDAITGEYQRTGRNLGTFANPEAANAYAGDLHNDYAAGKFDGKSVLNTPIMIPPEPIKPAPTATGMLSAARDMQKYQEGPKTRPVANQPMFRSPEEQAQMKGNAMGIEEGAKRDAQSASDVKYWKSIGLSDQEIKEMVKRKAMGTQSQMQDADAGFWTDNGQVVRAVRLFNPMTGEERTVNALTRIPLSPGATPAAAPAQSKSETDPTSLKEYNAYVEDETKRGNSKVLSYDAWLTMDANRKKSATHVNINSAGLNANQQFNALTKLQGSWNKESKAYDTMVNQYNLMQQGLKQAQAGNLNAGSQAILVTFQKILDPNSVVRESEYARSPEGLGLMQRLQGAMVRLTQGGAGVPVSELQGFVQAGAALLRGVQGSLDVARKQVEAGARVGGLNPQDVFGTSSGTTQIQGASSAPGGNASGAKAGDKKVAPNGRVLYFDGQGWGTEPVMPPPPGR